MRNLIPVCLSAALLGVPCFASLALAADKPLVKQAFDGYAAEEVHGWVANFTLADALAVGRPALWFGTNGAQAFPTAVIPAGNAASTFEISPMAEVPGITAETALGRMALAEFIVHPQSYTRGSIVVHKGKIVYEDYPDMAPVMKHLWSSCAKTISGLLVHMLVEDGRVDLAAPVETYLDYTKGSPIGAVSVGDVLNMRSGIDFEENQANRQNPDHPVAWAFAAALSARGVPAGPSLSEIVVGVPAIVPPNTVFGYSTFNTLIIGQIVEVVTGKPWNQVFSERIWQKAGMQGDGLVALSPAGEGLWGGILAGNLRDLARYGLLYTPSWTAVAKERVVSESYFDKVYADVNPDIYLKGEAGPKYVDYFGKDDAPIGNAYQWDAVFKDGDLYKSGLLGQGLYVSPKTDTVVVWFSTTWQNHHPMTAYSRAIVKQVFRKQ